MPVPADDSTPQDAGFSPADQPARQQEPFLARLVEPEPELVPQPEPVASGNQRLLQSKAVVLLILFCVTGFLGIPLLWANKRFRTSERVVWSIVVTIYTLALIGFAAAVCYWSYLQIVGTRY